MQPISYDDLKQAKEENPNIVDTVESEELTDLQEVLDQSGEKKKNRPVFFPLWHWNKHIQQWYCD